MAERSFAKELEKLRLGEGQVFHGEGILAVTKARDFDQALAFANATEYGLTGAVYTRDRDKIAKAKRKDETGAWQDVKVPDHVDILVNFKTAVGHLRFSSLTAFARRPFACDSTTMVRTCAKYRSGTLRMRSTFSRANCSAPSPASSTWRPSRSTASAARIGCSMRLTPITPPARRSPPGPGRATH